MDTSSAPPAPPPPSSVLFARAVQQGWGGAGGTQKRTWLASVLVDAFEETVPTPDDQYVEEMLLQILADEFDVDVQDGSAEAVALDVVQLWDETRVGKDELVRKFEEKAVGMRGKRAAAQEISSAEAEEWEDEDEDDDDDGSAMDEDEAPQLVAQQPRPREEPEVDEDGFTMVKGKGKSHR
ncbi:Pre-rRNA-processing protein TSR2-domain-containing protein [Roridomyces roridus]|uniref:Pre-rRNA-processing protein TSR2-domain-containing protein n=1 Tax=Roridomyces roridus TaxID=1738132 RepID=A0AAD7BJU6_9AGAR|nr:Pre-rRNA-processing protein TSR2-domain-containing protein [Roridomyces roridus]